MSVTKLPGQGKHPTIPHCSPIPLWKLTCSEYATSLSHYFAELLFFTNSNSGRIKTWIWNRKETEPQAQAAVLPCPSNKRIKNNSKPTTTTPTTLSCSAPWSFDNSRTACLHPSHEWEEFRLAPMSRQWEYYTNTDPPLHTGGQAAACKEHTVLVAAFRLPAFKRCKNGSITSMFCLPYFDNIPKHQFSVN